MKTVLLLAMLIIFSLPQADAQNPYNYETKIVIIDQTRDQDQGPFNPSKKVSNADQIQIEANNYNSQGFKLVSITPFQGVATAQFALNFERSNSYREAELYKLISELTTRIDTTSKKQTDSAMVIIQTNVLNYLKSIPNDVITQAYKDELTKMIMAQADTQLKAMAEELKKEIRDSAKIK